MLKRMLFGVILLMSSAAIANAKLDIDLTIDSKKISSSVLVDQDGNASLCQDGFIIEFHLQEVDDNCYIQTTIIEEDKGAILAKPVIYTPWNKTGVITTKEESKNHLEDEKQLTLLVRAEQL